MNALAVHHNVDRIRAITSGQALKGDAMLPDLLARSQLPHSRARQSLKHFCHSSPLRQHVMGFARVHPAREAHSARAVVCPSREQSEPCQTSSASLASRSTRAAILSSLGSASPEATFFKVSQFSRNSG